jgi:hypothetical protein
MAHRVIGQLPTGQSGYVREAVNRAFLDGLQVSALVCAGIALGAAIIVGWLLPARSHHDSTDVTDPTDIDWDQLEKEIR